MSQLLSDLFLFENLMKNGHENWNEIWRNKGRGDKKSKSRCATVR